MKIMTAHNFNRTRSISTPDTPYPRIDKGFFTIFDQDWCLMAVDEVHGIKGQKSAGFVGAAALARKAVVAIGCTATPVMTQATVRCAPHRPGRHIALTLLLQDLLNIARIIGIPSVAGQDGVGFEKDFQRTQRQAYKKVNEEKSKRSENLADIVLKGHADKEFVDPTRHVKAANYSSVKQLQTVLSDRIIRRTHSSLRPDGKPITTLLKKLNVHLFFNLEPWEYKILNVILADLSQTTNSIADCRWEVSVICFFLEAVVLMSSSSRVL